MFDIGFGEMLALFVVAMFVFGPDKLPKIAAEAGRMVRQLRRYATDARSDLREHLGPDFEDFDVRDLDPRTAVRRALWDDEPDDYGRAPAVREEPPLTPGERPPYDADAT